MAEGFLLGPNLLSRTRRAVELVEGNVSGGGFTSRAPALEFEESRRSVFRIATFTGAWSIGAVKTVNLKYVPGAANTVNATNLFAAVPAPTGSGDCAIAKEGTAWFLIAAVCGTAT